MNAHCIAAADALRCGARVEHPVARLLLIVLAVSLEASLRATTPTFTPTGSLHVARAGHQATLLLDGRVLVTGGHDNAGNAIAPAEIFSAVTGTWSTAASNLTPRMDHAAARLRDGRVLVVGGASSFSSCGPNATAEIYDPSSGEWSRTSDLPIATGSGAIAVTLRDSRVLAAGGGNRCGEIVKTAALFNPSTNTWSTTASMTVPRAFHSAVLLADGRVLVTGGAAAAEIYDPARAEWTAIEGPGTSRSISCGGYAQTFLSILQSGSVLAAGGISGDCASSVGPAVTVDLFDPRESRWSSAGKLEVARGLASVTSLPDGRVLVAGGYTASGTLQSSAEFFDPAVGGWNLNGALSVARGGHTATRLVNGTVLIAGGSDAAGRTAAAEIYIPDIGYETNTHLPARAGFSNRAGRHFLGGGRAIGADAKGRVFVAYPPGTYPVIAEWDLQREPLLAGYVSEFETGLNGIHMMRIDRDDNIWAVDAASNTIVKFDSERRPVLRLGQRDPSMPPGAGLDGPTDLAVDRSGNVFVTDERHARVVKYGASGGFIKSVGSPGQAPREMKAPHSVATDARGRVYVADGNARIQVFDNDLNLLAVYDTVGQPWALCITPGPHQYLYSSSNPDQSDNTKGRTTGEIYKLELDGVVVGRLGRADNPLGNFPTLHMLDCRQENEILATNIRNFIHVIKLRP
jgi:NHL repeat/Galactose oxidase, central domain/Kelch motif